MNSKRGLLVVEDGHEYEEFARVFLADTFVVSACHSAGEAVAHLTKPDGDRRVDGLLLDLRFERSPAEDLEGDIEGLAARRFGGDRARALQRLQDQQGTVVLARLREVGCDAPAVFVHDFPARRLSNLRRMYGRVSAVPRFDASAIRAALVGSASS